MTLLGGTASTLATLAFASVVLVFGAYLIMHRDPRAAGEKTARRATGVASGATAAAVGAATVGTEVIMQLPEIVIALVGLGSIVAGVSWRVAAVAMLIAYLVAEVVNGGPRYA